MKRVLLSGLFFTVLMLFGKLALAQNPNIPFDHLTNEEGLPNSTVFNILQDKKGFLWFGTKNGLCRYDGYNFTLFKTIVNNDHTISDNWVSTLFEDSKGVLYVGTWNQGLNIYNNKNENFIRYKISQNKDSLGSNNIRSIKEDSKGMIWIGTADNGFYSYDKKERKFTSFSLPPNCINNCIDMIIDKDDNLWIVNTRLELFKFATRTKEFKVIKKSFSNEQNFEELKAKLLIDRKGILWICTNFSGLYNYDLKNNIIKHWISDPNNTNSLNSNIICDIQETNDGKIWIATDGGGIDIFDVEKNKFYHNTHHFNNSKSLSSNAVYCLYLDSYNNIWAGTYLSGINIYNPNKLQFSTYLPNTSNQSDLSSNSVLAIYQDMDGDFLIGTDGGGMQIYNPDKLGGNFIHYNPDETNPKSACPEVVKTIYQTKNGIIWIGTWNNGLVKFDEKTNKFTYLGWDNTNPEALASPYVWSIMEDDKNLLWIGIWPFGVDIFDWKTNKVVKQIRQSNGFKGKYVSQIFKDSKGRIWVATEDAGLNRYIAKSDKFVNYQNDPNNQRSLSYNSLSGVFEDSKGTIWIETQGGGLNKYDEITDDFTVINEKNGLINNEIAGILEDGNGDFWISSNKGIFKFSPSTYITRSFDIDDGIQGNLFNNCASLKSKDGRFYFGGTNGFSAFYPERIKVNSYQPPLYIVSFSIFNKLVAINSPDSILKQSIIETKEITLPYSKSVFTFEYASLNFNRTKKNQYAYRMENFEDNWNFVGNKRYATYTNLDPGQYTFLVKATNDDGVWNGNPTSIKITITPPFYYTLWFKALIAFSILLCVFLFYNWRTSQLKRQKKILEKKVSERTADLKNANTELEEQKEEILQQNEEIKLQKEVVEEQHAKIETAYQKLTLNEQQLEKVVEERTKQLVIAKQKAEESDKLKSSFLANLSHEIRTPLNAIVGFSGLLIDGKAEQEEQEMFKSMIQSSSDSLLNLINDILDFSKIEAGQVDIIEAPVNLSKIIAEIRELSNHTLLKLNSGSNKEIDFRIISPPEFNDMVIISDENRLKQILQNLINNAFKFTSKGFVELSFELINDRKFLKFSVKDTGIGISKENQEIIFGQFRKIENPSSNLYRGTGIGLSICKHLVKMLGGTIGVESDLGKGSVFHFTIPFQMQNIVSKKDPTQFIGLQIPNFKDKNILIVEDEDSNFILIELYLKKTNATIIRASNGLEALELYNKNPNFDIILMDIKMPVMDGFEALKNIRKNKSSAIIIAQTAHSYTDEIEKIKVVGFTDYLLKPIGANKLYLTLQKYLE